MSRRPLTAATVPGRRRITITAGELRDGDHLAQDGPCVRIAVVILRHEMTTAVWSLGPGHRDSMTWWQHEQLTVWREVTG